MVGIRHDRGTNTMLRWIAKGLSLALLLALIPSAAFAQANVLSWQLLHAATLVPKDGVQTITIPGARIRTTAIRLQAKDQSVEIARVMVSYGNGQTHFETRSIELKPGERTRPIDERVEARIVEAVALTLAPGKPPAAGAVVEIWGLAAPQPVVAPPVAAAQPKLRPRGVAPEAAAPSPSPGAAPAPPAAKRYVEVPVFFGTTRRKEVDRIKNNRRLANFSGEQGDGLTLGRSIVTVPVERQPGTIPRPETNLIITRIAFRNEDPNRDFTIAAVDVMERNEFAAEMRKQVALSSRFKNQAFVFVHGYNVSFDDAIFRTAQIAHDIVFDGPAIAFSWPSRGGTWDYRHDIDTAKASREGLRQLLETVARDTGVTAVNLVAHSMGNDPVIEVLSQQADIVARRGQTVDFRLNEIVLAAPDISRKVFQQLAARFSTLAKGGVTLYASRNDLAMTASKRVASGLVRAGDVPREGIVIVPGVESIDISDASTSFLSTNHSTFADRAHLVADMQLLFERTTDKHPPDVRFRVYQTQGAQQSRWWRYRRN